MPTWRGVTYKVQRTLSISSDTAALHHGTASAALLQQIHSMFQQISTRVETCTLSRMKFQDFQKQNPHLNCWNLTRALTSQQATPASDYHH